MSFATASLLSDRFLGAPEKAEEDFAKALEQNADDPDIYYHRAQLYFIKGEFADAAKDYQKSIDGAQRFLSRGAG